MLRKVASLTYDLAMEQKQQLNSPKMRTSLERHDLNSLENFEGINLFNLMLNIYYITGFDCNTGQMLVSNLLSSIDEDHYLRLLISNQDLRLLMSHFVNYLLNIGIVYPLEDGQMCDKFMVSNCAISDLLNVLYRNNLHFFSDGSNV